MSEENKITKQTIEKSLQWYFHPNETVRMLRYFQFNLKFDNSIDYSVHYSDNPKIGVVIGTYGCIPYIDLQLHFLKNVNHIDNILIHDDCSPYQEQLKELTNKYNVDFYSTQKRMWHKSCIGSIGDTNSFYQGLLWSKYKGLDILVKLSRRLIPCYNWKDSLIQLALNSDASTFSSFCTKDPFNIRTEGIGLNVDIWTKSYPLQGLLWTIENEYSIFAEFWMHEMAKTLSGNNYSQKWKEYCDKHKYGYLHSGYGMWQDILGTCRYTNENRHENVLWHMYNSIEDYLNVSKQIFGDKYTLQDFNDCENF